MAENTEIKDKREVVSSVLDRIKERTKDGDLMLPKNYAVENALRSAYFIIGEVKDKDGKPALDVCTPASISEALFRMAIQGLSPDKNQAYFLVNGSKLSMRRSYQGAIVVSKRVANVMKVPARTVHVGDTFDQVIVDGEIVSVNHVQDPANLDKPILFAYAIAKFEDGSKYYDVMTFSQIKRSWAMSQNPGEKNKLQNNFSVDAAQRTVINRCCRNVINQSTDANLYEKDFTDETEVEEAAHEVVSSTTNSQPISGTKRIGLPVATEKQTVPAAVAKEPEPAAVVQEKPKQGQAQQQQEPPKSANSEEDPTNW